MTTRFQVRTTLLAVSAFLFPPAHAAVHTGLLHSAFEHHPGDGGARYIWNGPDANVVLGPAGQAEFHAKHARGPRSVITMRFPGADVRSMLRADADSRVQARYYNETDPGGSLRPQFRAIRYRDLYPGIDLVFRIDRAQLEYDFELAPHADPSIIRIDYGAVLPRLDDSGDLQADANGLRVIQKRPLVYQVEQGVRMPVPCRYRVTASGLVALSLGSYDSGRPLTIDPVLTFSQTFGGQGFDVAYAMVQSGNAIYIAGETDSVSLSGWGRRASRDAFVAKMDSTASTLLYVTYLGGSLSETARGLAVDASGNAYVAGVTNSPDFPTTSGAYSTSNNGMEDAFVVKLDASGARVYATLMGSAGSDSANGIAVDSAGNAYVTGQTSWLFPTTVFAPQRGFAGGTDCFIAKLNPAGTGLLFSTLLGGTGLDACYGIALDATGAYVTGVTYSSNFPVKAALQSSLKGIADAFVAKIDTGGLTILYSTFLGGDSFEDGAAITVDSSGSAYVTGRTLSRNFPVTAGSAQTAAQGDYDAFVAKLSASGDALAYATLIGGSGSDAATSIAVDSSGRAIVAGFTTSLNLPVQQAAQSTLAGSFDAFAVVLDKFGSSLLLCSYLGGAGDDRAYAAASGSGPTIYMAGTSQSPDFPKTAGSALTAGNADIFVAALTYTLPIASGKVFVPVTACRIADTRTASGFASPFGSPYLGARTARSFPITAGGCGVPYAARAYSLNITALPRGPRLQYITVWPSGQWQPVASTLNAFDGRVVTNSAILPAGTTETGGGVSIYASEDTDILVDINGYFVDPGTAAGLFFYRWDPCRIADTRGFGNYAPGFGTPYMPAGSTRTFAVAQSPCMPPPARAYSLNVTVLPRTATLQSLTMWPTGNPKPGVMTLSSLNGQVAAGATIVAGGTNGSLDVSATQDIDVLFDINGYFAPGGDTGLSFTPVTPCRVIDTRQSTSVGPATAQQRSIDVLGSPCGIPASARAYSVNVTVLPVKILQFLSVWPTGQPYPSVSTLNSFNGAVVANAAIVPAGAGGKIDVYASEQTEIIIDINGYFAP